MNREDVIRMAREAGWTSYDSQDERFERFAALVAAAERERVMQVKSTHKDKKDMTPEERIRRCVEFCVEAQYMDSEQYLRMMHDSASEPVKHLIEAAIKERGQQ